jgi:antitoxin component YwqK of YwqJK toxin-antitoxin module
MKVVKTRFVAWMKNGKYIDKKITFYENGNMEKIDSLLQPCDTNNVACDEILVKFYKNRNISGRYTILNKEPYGLTQQYDSNGKLTVEYVLKNNSKRYGEYKEYYENGLISYKGTFKNDTAIGFSYYFEKNGDTSKFCKNVNGEMGFPYKRFFENGTSIIGNASDSMMNSVTWVWNGKDGKEIKRKKVKPNKGGGFVTPDH